MEGKYSSPKKAINPKYLFLYLELFHDYYFCPNMRESMSESPPVGEKDKSKDQNKEQNSELNNTRTSIGTSIRSSIYRLDDTISFPSTNRNKDNFRWSLFTFHIFCYTFSELYSYSQQMKYLSKGLVINLPISKLQWILQGVYWMDE